MIFLICSNCSVETFFTNSCFNETCKSASSTWWWDSLWTYTPSWERSLYKAHGRWQLNIWEIFNYKLEVHTQRERRDELKSKFFPALPFFLLSLVLILPPGLMSIAVSNFPSFANFSFFSSNQSAGKFTLLPFLCGLNIWFFQHKKEKKRIDQNVCATLKKTVTMSNLFWSDNSKNQCFPMFCSMRVNMVTKMLSNFWIFSHY